MSQSATPAARRRKRGTVIRLSLAGLALVGIGAAATTAAWTDNVFFSATATTGTFNLQGSVDGTTFVEGDSLGTAITVPATSLTGLTPGDTKTVTLTIKNVGDLAATLGASTVTPTGVIFTGTTPATALVTADVTGKTLAPGASTTLTLTVAAPTTWDRNVAYQGKTGTVVVKVAGASS